MTKNQTNNKYSEDFKKSLVMLNQNGKTLATICKEYSVSSSALNRWVKLYSEVKTENGDVLTMQQVKVLQKKLAALEEENIILKKAAALFMHDPNKK